MLMREYLSAWRNSLMSRWPLRSASISENTLKRPARPLEPCLLSWRRSLPSVLSMLNLGPADFGSGATLSPWTKAQRFASSEGLVTSPIGLPSCIPITDWQMRSDCVVCADTSISFPKSFGYATLSHLSAWLVPQWKRRTGSVERTGWPSAWRRLVGSGCTTIHTVLLPSAGHRLMHWRRENFAKWVVDTGIDRKKSGSSPPASSTGAETTAGLATTLSFCP
mmetsp:Transcript_28393/g.92726  ORF Transcript_28393/g.92726 Transcript_28393/m.92726 type:complete len:222 (-) Transcript_28393:463-1128(-)